MPGRPAMFGTTRQFLDYFGLKKLDDLPPLADLSDWESLRVQLNLPEVSADEPEAGLQAVVGRLLDGIAERLGASPASVGRDRPVEADDRQVGAGYGVPTAASTEALELFARREGILLDPVYTAKAAAGLLARVRSGELTAGQTVLFWHTGGQIAFAERLVVGRPLLGEPGGRRR